VADRERAHGAGGTAVARRDLIRLRLRGPEKHPAGPGRNDVVARPRRADRIFLWTVGPGLVYLLAFFLAPMAIVAAFSFTTSTPSGEVGGPATLDGYRRALDPLYLSVLGRSTWLALITTAISLVIAFPAAWAVRAAPRRWQSLLLALVILPSWMNLLVKNYAWIVILRRQGVINSLLLSLGVIQEPLPLLFNDGAVLVGLVHTYLPFMLLPIYVALDRMDWRLVEAARDLAASGWQTFRHVVLPQTIGGVVVGCTLVFVPTLGAFVTPDLLGGPRSLMVGTLIENQVLQVRDWPFAAALSMTLMAVVAVALLLSRRWLIRPGEESVL
jgi:spermidine/putrescine transport system permease protein